jgi:large subunit ribosomal protein L9
MKVLLLKEVENLGALGDIVVVKNGYGLNYLIPRGLARIATPGLQKMQAELQRQQSRKLQQQKGSAQEVARQLEASPLVMTAKTGEDNRIFGTITTQIAIELAKKGFDIDRRKIVIEDEIKTTGEFAATISVHPDVDAKLTIVVEPSETEVA